ncbi:general transcription factor IIE subunit 1 [Planococcus citri]|uniref:general transcription factor IIE subunit 1 n=1 Tax=Planococcus citri TaxID=170843 RepID=UPI0031F9139E
MAEAQQLVTEVPSSLKQLARLVARGFYTIEDALVVDMLVRNPCMKEDDICELLKFERKMLRSRIAGLKNDKFIQVRLRMETGPDGKAQKVNYYFINYKTFVNVVKYKLDVMRKKMETEERRATSRASFICHKCCKTFTDLEADQLFDITTNEFRCTFCYDIVEEDLSALPKHDSRSMIARFNSQFEPLYVLLREVERLRLAPELLEPEPVDISSILGKDSKTALNRPGDQVWSGEATRHKGPEKTEVAITIGDESSSAEGKEAPKERPVWLLESTVIDAETSQASMMLDDATTSAPTAAPSSSATNTKNTEDIMSVLLQHEKRGGSQNQTNLAAASIKNNEESSDSSGDEPDQMGIPDFYNPYPGNSNGDGDDDDDEVPMIPVGSRRIPVTDIDESIVSQMTQEEKSHYIQVFQEYYDDTLA